MIDRADLRSIASNLEQRDDGVWVATGAEPTQWTGSLADVIERVEETSFWYQHRSACLKALMRQLPPPGAVFDIGGGTGFLSQAMAEFGVESVLVEPDPHAARLAKARGLRNVICSSYGDAGFEPGSLPAVGTFDVLEHIQDDATFLTGLRKLLRPGGRLYVTVPAHPILWSVNDVQVGHRRRYSRAGLEDLVARAGFDVEYLSPYFWFLPLPILLFRALPSRLGRASYSDRRREREHTPSSKLSARAVRQLLAFEVARIRRGQSLPTGASLILVARTR